MMAAEIPNNDGYFRPIHVAAPEGSVVNLRHPAACAGRGITCYRIADAMFGVLAKVLPHRVPAAGEGGVQVLSLGGYDENGYVMAVNCNCGTPSRVNWCGPGPHTALRSAR